MKSADTYIAEMDEHFERAAKEDEGTNLAAVAKGTIQPDSANALLKLENMEARL